VQVKNIKIKKLSEYLEFPESLILRHPNLQDLNWQPIFTALLIVLSNKAILTIESGSICG
jgi:hypothetical protein